jgi:hypothetical protein
MSQITDAAERDGQLDPQSLAVQSIGVLIGRALLIAGKLPWSFGGGKRWPNGGANSQSFSPT